MNQIINNLFLLRECKLGEASSTVYLLNTNSKDGLIVIDTGIGFDFKNALNKIKLNPKKIQYCLLTHGHFDHIEGCKALLKINPDIRFFMHQKDVKSTEMLLNEDKGINFKITDQFTEKVNTLELGEYRFKCIHIPGHTPGGMAFLTEIDNNSVLFAGDLCGGGVNSFGGDHDTFKRSLQQLLEKKIDILCEGHMNVIEPSQKVSEYIEGCLKINDYLHIGLDKDPKNTNNWYNFALTCYRLKIYDNAYEACKYILNLNPEHTKARELLEEIRSKYSFKYEHSIEQSLKKIYGEDY